MAFSWRRKNTSPVVGLTWIDLEGIHPWSFRVNLTERPSFIFSLPRRVAPIRPLTASASEAAQLCFASIGIAMG